MPLDIILCQMQSLSHMVRSAELALALDASGGSAQTQVVLDGCSGIWRHLMSPVCQRRLRALQAARPTQSGAHCLWLGPSGAAPETLPYGTWCLETDCLGDVRRMMTGHMALPMWLAHPYAPGAAKLGGTRHTTIPMAVSAIMQARTAQAPSGVCVIGSGEPDIDRACVALVASRTAGDIVFFDPYQHHLARGLPNVKRIVAPCGPSRRSMLYASCRYVVAAARSIRVDDHFVCEAVAMGLVPLATFAPSDGAPTDPWNSHVMAEAFSAAVAHRSPAPAPLHISPTAQAVSVWQHLRRTAQGRPWGTGGSLGVVQSLSPDDVACVRHADRRALVVMCGVEACLGADVRSWLVRCNYRSVCITGLHAGACHAFLHQALADAAQRREQAVTADITQAAGDAALATWIIGQRSAVPGVQFDIVHLGATAADVLHMRGFVQRLEQQQVLNDSATDENLLALTLIVRARAEPEPLWVTQWCKRWPHTFVLQHDASDTMPHSAQDPADAAARAQVQALLSLDAPARVIDAGGGGNWLGAACRASGRGQPYMWAAEDARADVSHVVDKACFARLHRGHCRAAQGLSPDACIILLAAPHLDDAGGQALLPLWPIVRALYQFKGDAMFVVLAPGVDARVHAAVQQDLTRFDLHAVVTLIRELGDPFDAAYDATPLHAHSTWWGAADVYVDGPWTVPDGAHLRACAAAAGLPFIVWSEVRTAPSDEDKAMAAFRVDAGPQDAMAASLLTYLQTLCIDVALRHRLGERGKRAFVQSRATKTSLDALAARFAPTTPTEKSPRASSAFAHIAARMRVATGLRP